MALDAKDPTCVSLELDTRTVNEVVTARIAQLRERADEMESKLASMPAEFLDMRIHDLTRLDIYL